MAWTRKTKYVGKESLKSSNRWFSKGADHPKGHGASAGNGRTSDTAKTLGPIRLVFKKATDR